MKTGQLNEQMIARIIWNLWCYHNSLSESQKALLWTEKVVYDTVNP